LIEILKFDVQKSEISFQKDPELIDSEFLELSIESEEEVPVFAARILTQTPLNEDLPPTEMRLGSTRGTNALLEGNGARTAFLVTAGFKDLIRIGTQQREDLFALEVIKPQPYFDQVFEIEERINANGEITQPFTVDQIEDIGRKLRDLDIESIAIAFLNSYKNPIHELEVGKILEDSGFKHISLSSELFNAIKILPRAETAVANAYLSPVIKNYISNIESSVFSGHEGDLKVMTSAGGLIASNAFKPKDSLLSGPAGGLVGASVAAGKSNVSKILTLDMGGTSTDVARYNDGFDYRYETKVGNARILSPALFIETIAAGGGSVCRFDGFRFTVGPESARANPGPACYGAGGPLTITDVNLLLGKIDPDNFGIPVHQDASKKALKELQNELSSKYKKSYSQEDILSGFEQIANEKMAEAIKKISVSKGYDPREYSLLAFGGAGGQHACQVAEILGMDKVLIPMDAGLLSAYGIGQAYIERFAEKQVLLPLSEGLSKIDDVLQELESKVIRELKNEGFPSEEILIRDTFFYLRFEGQENTLEVKKKSSILHDFKLQYENLYGHWIENREIEVESIKVAGCNVKNAHSYDLYNPDEYKAHSQHSHSCWVRDKWQTIPSFDRALLKPGAVIKGPAVIGSLTSTSFIQDGWKCFIDQSGNCLIEKVEGAEVPELSVKKPMEAELELFSNRFTAVAEEMGAMFQRTSFSVNIKERLDFSCAILDADGFLVVNAPHIPVHLGSLGICVRKLKENIQMEEGDVVITNHPGYGGSHLPDITLVSPIYYDGELSGYVANRGHHAEVGGMLPGSMPPEAKSLLEEGVVIEPTYLVKKGEAQWEHIRKIFTEARYPTRSIEENIADLNGALASIRLGVEQMTQLIQHYGMSTIESFMSRIREHAHKALLDALIPYDGKHLKASEYLDNEAELNVEITINHPNIKIDFSGTSGEQKDNFNATPAITTSAILYVLRLIANKDIPLNEGLLNTVDIVLPRNLLNPDFDRPPSECPPVVGGNTETSQRLVDTLIKAFELSGCSQGTMNNLLFGNQSFGYYETICGGTGAGNGFHGADAIHHHMTNTRITDPEIMELRYPVIIKEFSIRKNSGGEGQWRGGDGIVRKIVFTKPVELTVMTQHREFAPFGMKAGSPGEKGTQWIEKPDGSIVKLKGCESYSAEAGDTIVMNTPGGGGYGKPDPL
jgi:5-oxoprolinase (ATP-hydrolysing)